MLLLYTIFIYNHYSIIILIIIVIYLYILTIFIFYKHNKSFFFTENVYCVLLDFFKYVYLFVTALQLVSFKIVN